MNIARDLACLGPGAAPRLQRTDIAVPLGGAVEQHAPVMHRAAGAEPLAVGTDVVAMPLVPDEVSPREDAVRSIALLPDRDRPKTAKSEIWLC